MPLVSVILTSYNQARYLPESVESVLAQSFQDFELIIVDNGSTDRSPKLLRSYQSDPRVRLVLCSENGAISRRFNEGIALSRGSLVSFHYSDDMYLPNKLERQVSAFASLDPDWGVVYCPAYGLNDITRERWIVPTPKVSGRILEELLRSAHVSIINMLSPMIRRECLLRYPFYEDVFAEGEAWFFRAAMEYKFHFIEEPLVVLRDHLSNAGKAAQANIEMTEIMLDRLLLEPEFSAENAPYVRMFRARLLRKGAWSAVRVSGDISWARRSLLRSVRLDPRVALDPRMIAGMTLSLLPDPLRRSINRIGNGLRRSSTNRVNVKGAYT